MSAERFPEGQRRHCACYFNVADDAMQMNVHKTSFPFYTTTKMPQMLRQQSQKMLFVDSNSHVYYDNLHNRQGGRI